MITTELHECLVLSVPVAEILPLRRRVLRAGFSLEEARFEGDNDRHTHHFAASLDYGQSLVCCATFMFSEYEKMPAWWLRGLATEPGYRNRGIGAQLLRKAERELAHNVRYQEVHVLWCNAREEALTFYEQNGWERVSDRFDIPTVGPHFKMVKRL